MHQFQDKNKINKKKKIIRNIIGFSLFFILCILGFLSWTGQIFNYIGEPIWKTEKLVGNTTSNFNYLIRSKAVISKENNDLKKENENLKLTMIDYKILKNDLDQLKETLGRVSVEDTFILGNILTKPNHSPYDTLIIDIGNNLGVKEGDLIYANGNIPIGIISKIYDKTSLVNLFTSPGQKTEGFINELNASIELIGRGGGNFEMIIPVELKVEKGTIIYLPDETSLVVAQVDEIISSPTDPFKKVILSSPVNVQNIKSVFIKKD